MSWLLVRKILLVVGAAYLVLVAVMWILQTRLAFPAPKYALPAPAGVGFPGGELITVVAHDGVPLRGWFLPPDRARAATSPVLIWFYGNMEGVGVLAPVFREWRPPDMALLALDYRGYGTSGGQPNESAMYRDALSAWDYLVTRPDVDTSRIAVYGRSVGSAIALYLATHRPARAVVLDSPLSSARDMAARHYWYLPRFLVRLSLDNVTRARRLEAPLMVVHGSDDWIAPVEMGRRVAEAGRAEVILILEGVGHNDTYDVGGDDYRTKMHRFLRDALESGRPEAGAGSGAG